MLSLPVVFLQDCTIPACIPFLYREVVRVGDLRDQNVDGEDANLLDADDEELMRHLFENMEEDDEGDDDDDDDEEDDGDEDDDDDEEDDDDDEAAEEQEEDIDMQDSRLAWLGIRAGHRFSRQLARFQKLSTCTSDALQHDAAQMLNHSTAAVNAKHSRSLVCLPYDLFQSFAGSTMLLDVSVQ